MRRALIGVAVGAAFLWAPPAFAAPPQVAVSVSDARGAAPFAVTLHASGDLATYHWDFGDGTFGDGPTVQHVYGAGAFTPRVTATSPLGEQSGAGVSITSLGLVVKARHVVTYRRHLRFKGRLVPAERSRRIGLYLGSHRLATGKTGKKGGFKIGARVTAPGQYVVRFEDAVSKPVAVAVRPVVRTSFTGSGVLGRPLVFNARVRPARAARLRIRIWGAHRLLVDRTYGARARVRLPTRRVVAYRIRVDALPVPGYTATAKKLRKVVFVPRLGPGSRGASVHALEVELARQHYALAAVDGYYGQDTYDAAIAFEKVHGLPRTGSVDARFWRVLLSSSAPIPRYGGDHIEVNKSLQYLMVVRGGKTTLVVPVSTGATGNTPVGRWHVYSKVPGYNAKEMFYSSFFIGAFAIHGYHSVPAYPASHGCVRIPIWVATRVYGLAPYGSAVYIYY